MDIILTHSTRSLRRMTKTGLYWIAKLLVIAATAFWMYCQAQAQI